MGPYLFEIFTGAAPEFAPKNLQRKKEVLFTAGSILRHVKVPDKVTIWGSGIISETDEFSRPRSVLAVRGPRTRRRMLDLGYDCPEVYGDPAVLLPLFYNPVKATKTCEIGVIPHFTETELYIASDVSGRKVIDVSRDVESVIDDICSVEVAFSSSLHGVVLAHAYGIPCIWMQSCGDIHGDGTKFHDYYESCNAEVEAINPVLGLPSHLMRRKAEVARVLDHRPLQQHLLSNLPNGWEKPL